MRDYTNMQTTHIVENWPGIASITGPDLMSNMRSQAEQWGAQLITDDCVRLDLSSSPYRVYTANSGTLEAHSLIIATGASAKRLGIPGEHDLWSRGISACAICDGTAPVFQGVELAVVGGGDSACEEAVYLTKYAKKVHLLVRSSRLRASKTLIERVERNEKVEIHLETAVIEALGGSGMSDDGVGSGSPLRGVRIRKSNEPGGKTKEESTLKCRGLFYAIGHTPNTKFLKGSGIKLDQAKGGQVATKTKGSPETHVEGVFVAGDVCDSEFRQAVTAAGSGCQAAISVERWLAERGLGEQVATNAGWKPQASVSVSSVSSTSSGVTMEADTEETFDEDATYHAGQFALRKLYHASNRALVVKYVSPGCGPCRQLKPILNAVIEEYDSSGKVHYVEIDISKDQEVAEAAGVTGSPTVQVFFEKGLVHTLRGVKMKSEYRRVIDSVVAGAVHN